MIFYKHREKGGVYFVDDLVKSAGTLRNQSAYIVRYRSVSSGEVFSRLQKEFAEVMEPLTCHFFDMSGDEVEL